MALTIAKQPEILSPAYSPIDYIITSDISMYKYEITITINGEVYTISLLPLTDNSVEFDISSEIQYMLKSRIYNYNEDIVAGNLIKDYPEDIITYHLEIKGYDTPLSYSTLTSAVRYAFNGTLQVGDSFDFINDYRMDATTEGKFLNNFGSKKCEVTDEHPITIQYFEGVFDTYTSQISDMYFRQLDKDFNLISELDSTIYPELLDMDYTATPKIKSVQIPTPTTENCKYIQVVSNESELLLIELVEANKIFDTYQIAWVNSLGGTDYYFFRGNNENVIDIDKDEYYSILDYSTQSKIYNIEIEDKIICYSDYISSDIAKNLKTLWFSPEVVSIENNVQKPIIIDVNNINIFNRVPSGTPIYKLEFKYANKYKIQQR